MLAKLFSTLGLLHCWQWLVSRLYTVAISACYVLAFLAVPKVRSAIDNPDLVTIFQVMAATVAGASVAVQFYHIPSLVGATFGCDKGLFSSYTDGVGYGIASLLWFVVGNYIRKQEDLGGGWAYGWAAVALLLILSGILMTEFMEHYFCRRKPGDRYETIMLA